MTRNENTVKALHGSEIFGAIVTGQPQVTICCLSLFLEVGPIITGHGMMGVVCVMIHVMETNTDEWGPFEGLEPHTIAPQQPAHYDPGPVDIEAIEARVAAALRDRSPQRATVMATRLTYDVPALVAEVRKGREAAEILSRALGSVVRELHRVEEELDRVTPVLDAWADAGPQPHAHRQAQRRLLRDWPTLANALVAAAPPIVGG
jgi:hypothetical protein